MRILIYIFFVFASISSYAQEYKKFKVGIAQGGVSINKAGGPSLSLEPAYRLSDRYTVGLRLEGIAIFGASDTPALIGSESINGQYYFTTRGVRPFIGAGVGIYRMSDNNGSIGSGYSRYERKIGFYPRIGFDYGHVTFNMEYNFMTQVKMVGRSVPPNSGNESVYYYNVNYFSVRAGVSIGGGKKKKP